MADCDPQFDANGTKHEIVDITFGNRNMEEAYILLGLSDIRVKMQLNETRMSHTTSEKAKAKLQK